MRQETHGFLLKRAGGSDSHQHHSREWFGCQAIADWATCDLSPGSQVLSEHGQYQ